MFLDNKGILFVLSSPSGGGKTTMADLLIKTDQNIVRSVSVTTRSPRENEVHSRDYFFFTEDEFKAACANDRILEYANVFGNYYGTPKQHVFDLLDSGKDVLCCIDWQGAKQIVSDTEAVTIFLLPPSLQKLSERLYKRSTDNESVILNRLKEAKNEIIQCCDYDYIVINHVVDDTVKELQSIIQAERAKMKHKRNIIGFIEKLNKEVI